MLRSLKELERYKVRATDGDIGTVVNFLLDDRRWTVRYLVVKAGGFFSGRQVVISPISFRQVDWPTREFHLALTAERVENSPGVDRPVQPDAQHRDGHLRSAREVTGYRVHGSDGVIGHVADFLVDDETWEVRYLVLETAHWWAGGQEVLVSPRWATSVQWEEGAVHLDLTRQAIKSSPAWDAGAYLDRAYEARLHQHYRRAEYWDDGGSPEGPRPSMRSSSQGSSRPFS